MFLSQLNSSDSTFYVTGGIKIRPNFLGQNDSFFSLSAPKKIESFWPKKLGHWRN